MRTVVMVCSRDLSHDSITNNVSVFSILEGLHAGGFPLLLTPFAALVVFEREANERAEYPGRFELLLGDRELLARDLTVNFRDRLRTRQMIRLEGLVVAAPGRVTARFFVEGEVRAEYVFQIEPDPRGQPQAQVVATEG
jgi:hypothetical protein